MDPDLANSHPIRPNADGLITSARSMAGGITALPESVRLKLFPASRSELRDDDLYLAVAMGQALTGQICEFLAPAKRNEARGGKRAPVNPDKTAEEQQQLLQRLMGHRSLTCLLYARAVEWRLSRNHSASGQSEALFPEIVERYIGHADEDMAVAAMKLLASQSRFMSNARRFYLDLDELPAEFFKPLVHLIIAALQQNDEYDPILLRARAEMLISDFDERLGRPHQLSRFIYLLGNAGPEIKWTTQFLGTSLSLRMLAGLNGLAGEHVILMLLEPGLERLALLMRAAGFDQDIIMPLLNEYCHLASQDLASLPEAHDIMAVTADEARSEAVRWRNLDNLLWSASDSIADGVRE